LYHQEILGQVFSRYFWEIGPSALGAAVTRPYRAGEISRLFHVSAVGVPGWVIGQKSKYEQGNKE
jgi:hypothetical protein